MPNRPGKVTKRASALRDLFEISWGLADLSLALSDRFLKAAEATFDRLASRPGIGAPWEVDDPRLIGVRCASIGRFKNYLVFYHAGEEGVEILRILHGARDLRELGCLIEDDGIDE